LYHVIRRRERSFSAKLQQQQSKRDLEKGRESKSKGRKKRKEGSHRKELLQALVREETDKINDTK